jgi:hypothetical protein
VQLFEAPDWFKGNNSGVRAIDQSGCRIGNCIIATIALYVTGIGAPFPGRFVFEGELMPDLDLINEAEQGVWDERGRFVRGCSGNPAGRPKGCHDHASRGARALLAGEGEALTRKAIELALAGDAMALRLCLDRLIGPCRERAVECDMPTIGGASDLAAAMAAVASAAAQGSVTPREAMQLGQVVEAYVRAVEATEFERRLKALEAADGAAP